MPANVLLLNEIKKKKRKIGSITNFEVLQHVQLKFRQFTLKIYT